MSSFREIYRSILSMYDSRDQIRRKTLETMHTLVTISEEDFDENAARRERRKKLNKQKEIVRMRNALPVYDLQEIRLFKLPFHEALMLQLNEMDFANTEGYLQELFKLNEKMKQDAGPQHVMWNLPLLKNSDKELKILSDALMKAESEHNNGKFRQETEILLVAAIDFAFNYTDWFWLAEELILQCISNAQKFRMSGKHEAICRYIYAKMLIERVKEFDKAEEELIRAREIATGKSWNVKEFMPHETSSNTLFMNANYFLYLCYIRKARQCLLTDPNKALELATLAKKRAIEACYYEGETRALYIKGQCELALANTKDAVSTFNKAFYIQSKLKSERGICEARVELSKAYLMHGSTRLALNTLMALKETAEKHGFQFYLAQAYRYLGEYYLNSGEPEKATPLLSDALNIFHSIGNMAEADQVRNLGALSSGLEQMPSYVALLQRTDKRCDNWYDNLLKLVRWKDSRNPFWADKYQKMLSGMDQMKLSMFGDQAMKRSTFEQVAAQMLEYEELQKIFDPEIESVGSENESESDPILPTNSPAESEDSITIYSDV